VQVTVAAGGRPTHAVRQLKRDASQIAPNPSQLRQVLRDLAL
jgi:hypothetical protein